MSHNVYNNVFGIVIVVVVLNDDVVIIVVIAHEGDDPDYGNDDADRYGHDHSDGEGDRGGDRNGIFCIASGSGRYHQCYRFYISFSPCYCTGFCFKHANFEIFNVDAVYVLKSMSMKYLTVSLNFFELRRKDFFTVATEIILFVDLCVYSSH